jgi:hypothetical protein
MGVVSSCSACGNLLFSNRKPIHYKKSAYKWTNVDKSKHLYKNKITKTNLKCVQNDKYVICRRMGGTGEHHLKWPKVVCSLSHVEYRPNINTAILQKIRSH